MLVVGKILSVEKHPNADMLVVTNVDLGTSIETIVTNDVTIEVGDKVVVATIGHEFDTFKIEKKKIRGIESNGMFCGGEVTGIGLKETSYEYTMLKGVTILDDSYIVGSVFTKREP